MRRASFAGIREAMGSNFANIRVKVGTKGSSAAVRACVERFWAGRGARRVAYRFEPEPDPVAGEVCLAVTPVEHGWVGVMSSVGDANGELASELQKTLQVAVERQVYSDWSQIYLEERVGGGKVSKGTAQLSWAQWSWGDFAQLELPHSFTFVLFAGCDPAQLTTADPKDPIPYRSPESLSVAIPDVARAAAQMPAPMSDWKRVALIEQIRGVGKPSGEALSSFELDNAFFKAGALRKVLEAGGMPDGVVVTTLEAAAWRGELLPMLEERIALIVADAKERGRSGAELIERYRQQLG